MSYLDVPRLHFAGEFVADPSTVNNYDTNFPLGATLKPTWDPQGRHHFKFENCTVRSGLSGQGALLQTVQDDRIIGARVVPTNDPTPARLVDVDVDWQRSSQIWGLGLRLESSVGTITGKLTTATLRDLWARAPTAVPASLTSGTPPIPPLDRFSGCYQSTLTDLVFDPPRAPTQSPVFNSFFGQPKLSVKFVLYAFDPVPSSPRFTHGKVVGTIGFADAAEPEHFIAGRRLSGPPPASGSPPVFAAAPFKVDAARGKLVIDLGNAIPQATPGGASRSLGTMQARVTTPGSATPTPLGAPMLYDQAHFEATAGVEEVSLTPAQVSMLATRAVSIAVSAPAGVILAERPGGSNLDVSETAFRLNFGESVMVEFAATVFGAPKAGQTIGLRMTFAGGAAAGLTFPASVTTNAAGRATATFTGGDPGHPRPSVDGGLYQISFDWGTTAAGTAPDQRGAIVIRVFDRVPAVVSPTWADVSPILATYAQLFPSMKGVIDLSNQAMCKAAATLLEASLKRSMTAPNYMPVTRDLSDGKKSLVLRWIAKGCP